MPLLVLCALLAGLGSSHAATNSQAAVECHTCTTVIELPMIEVTPADCETCVKAP
jgi:hypothetical protein